MQLKGLTLPLALPRLSRFEDLRVSRRPVERIATNYGALPFSRLSSVDPAVKASQLEFAQRTRPFVGSFKCLFQQTKTGRALLKAVTWVALHTASLRELSLRTKPAPCSN